MLRRVLPSKRVEPDKDLAEAQISPAGHAALLHMAYARLFFAFCIMPFVSLILALFYARNHEARTLAAWVLGYTVFAVLMFRVRRQYRGDEQEQY